VIERLWRVIFEGDRRPAAEPAATFYHAATPATTYLRCELPARHLPAELTGNIVYGSHPDGTIVFPDHQGAAAVMQLAADKQRAAVLHHMQAQGIRVLVETDDNYRAQPSTSIRRRAGWGVEIGDDTHTLGGHGYICRHADGVIVTTDYLARQYRKVNPNVFVCPNTIEPEDWPEPEKIGDDVFRICWFASLSHEGDIPLVTRALEWASRQPDVEVWAVGLNPRWRFKYTQFPWIDSLHQYRRSFQHFDVGVAPVKADPFGLGRSDVKFLEYAMGGCASVVSDCAPYASVPADVCVKAADAKGFLKAIQHLVRHRDEARQLAAAAREYVLSERTTAAQIDHWQAALNP
jgi:hypothetical protein